MQKHENTKIKKHICIVCNGPKADTIRDRKKQVQRQKKQTDRKKEKKMQKLKFINFVSSNTREINVR